MASVIPLSLLERVRVRVNRPWIFIPLG